MTSFLHHIISRHTGSSENVKPRIQSTFDHENFFSNDHVINDSREGEETEKKKVDPPGIEITGPPTDIRKNKNENKIPDPIFKEAVSQVTEPIQLIKSRESNSESQQQSIKNPVVLLKKDTGTGENKPVSSREPIISRSQKEHTEGSLNKSGEKISEQKNKIASSTKGSLPALTEIDESVSDDEIKPSLKDNGSTNVSPWRPGFKNKTEYPLPKIPSATTSSQTINISIDRIEIRAQFPQAETKMITKKEDKNILSLDQYLESRKPR